MVIFFKTWSAQIAWTHNSNWLAPIEGYMIFKLIEPSYIQFHDDESMFVSKDIDIAQWYLIYFTIELTVFYWQSLTWNFANITIRTLLYINRYQFAVLPLLILIMLWCFIVLFDCTGWIHANTSGSYLMNVLVNINNTEMC